MTTITIPKELARKGELVVIPKAEYEALSRWKEFIESIKILVPTPVEKKKLKAARKDYRAEHSMSLHEFKRKLGAKN